MKQVIIARKDLNMSMGKLAAQIAHASMAFLTNKLRANARKVLDCESIISGILYKRSDLSRWSQEAKQRGEQYVYFRPVDPNNPCGELELCDPVYHYQATVNFDINTWENWIDGSFTKVVCEAKNKNKLMKAVDIAKEIGLEENKDFFLIKDNCLTELEPEEIDSSGVGRTLTCIGFKPLDDEIASRISKKFQLYK